jgi:phosphomannomutase
MSIIRSISGLRATLYDDVFDENIIYLYINSLLQLFPEGKFVIGRDGRPSGIAMQDFIAKIMTHYNREFVLIGLAPTPSVQLIVEEVGAICGISITASHNPEEWNGLKFINKEGVFFDARENQELWDIIDSQKFVSIPKEIYSIDISNLKIANDWAIDTHINKLLNLQEQNPIFNKNTKFNINIVKSKEFRVVVDAVNASGSIIIPQLLTELGCKVFKLNCEGNGEFTHKPEPLPENLTELAKAVVSMNADIGIAVDPDGDRLVIIDEHGHPIGEENSIVLAVWSYLNNHNNPENVKVVVNHSTTQNVENVAKMFNAKVERSPVGEINVVNKMKEIDAEIGGEGSGGIILRDFHLGRDAVSGIYLLMNFLAQNSVSLSTIINKLPKTHIKKVKIEFSQPIEDLLDKIKDLFKDEECIIDDGLKFIGQDYWIQIRKSNTEPIIRIISEGTDENHPTNLIDKVFSIIKHY